MGVVYRAWDADLKREVALKTIRDKRDPAALELFRKESRVLASLNHPNIIDIYDIGELEENGAKVPYFVMPLLPGATLDKLIAEQPQRLTVERVVEIVAQVCRGLHAAHEKGLVHRDLKPSNIFVLNDDSVKIIDFGVAHLVDHQTSIGAKGTLMYMAPEQIEMKPATLHCDIFSLGVVCYECLARRRPFTGGTRDEIARGVLRTVPPPASEFNPAVSPMLSQVIHAAMAKQPFHRFSSAREFSDALQKAMRGQQVERFDAARIEPRIQRAEKALTENEPDFAAEILTELESEGHLHPAIRPLRRRVDQTIRDRSTAQLIESARRRMKDNEYQLALQKVQEVLNIDPENASALRMKTEIEGKRVSAQAENWLRIARQHLEARAFSPARDAARHLLAVNPGDTEAQRVLAEIDVAEQDYLRAAREKDDVYNQALDLWQRGDVSGALSRLEKVLEIDKQTPDAFNPDRSSSYQDFYNKVRSEHDAIHHAYQEARRHMESGNYAAAAAICDHYLQKYPEHALFQALRYDIGESERQNLSLHIAKIGKEVEAEPDLNRKVKMLEEAIRQNPGEVHFERLLKSVNQKRDLINSIVFKARNLEDRGQFSEALSQWDILRNIYPRFPGIEFEQERVERRRQQSERSSAKSRWVEQIDAALAVGEAARASSLVKAALEDFPGDAELQALEKLSVQAGERAAASIQSLEEAKSLYSRGRTDEGIALLRRVAGADPSNPAVRQALVEMLLKRAASEMEQDCNSALRLVDEALRLDPSHTQAHSLQTTIADRKRGLEVDHWLSSARELQAAGNLPGALEKVNAALALFPSDDRLRKLRDTLGRVNDTQFGATMASPPAPPPAATPAPAKAAASAPPKQATSKGPAAKPAPPPASAAPPAVKPPAQPPAASRGFDKRWLALAAVPLLAVAGWFAIGHKPPPPPPPVEQPKVETPPAANEIEVAFEVTPAEAAIVIGGRDFGSQRTFRLEPGAYEVEFQRDGFAPFKTSVEVAPGMTAPAAVVLKPLSGAMAISVGTSGRMSLNGAPLRLVGGRGSLRLDPNVYRIEVANAVGKANLTAGVKSAALPEIRDFKPEGLFAAVIATYANRAWVHGPVSVTMGGQTLPVAAGGRELPGLPAGRHLMTVSDGKERRQVDLEVGPAPMLYVYAFEPGLADFLISTNEDDATVTIDGKPAGTTRNRQFATQLPPGAHTVRVTKNAFSDPGERKVTVRPGMPAESFPLAGQLAGFTLVGAPPGAQVLVDNKNVGTVGPEGLFDYSLAPGSHTIGLRARDHTHKDATRTFAVGPKLRFAGRELLEAVGYVQLSVTPANATVTVNGGAEKNRAVREPRLTLPAGDYEFTALLPGGAPQTQKVSVKPGQTHQVALNVARQTSPSLKKEAAAGGLADFEGGPWEKGGDGWSELGGNQQSLIALHSPVTLVFKVQKKGTFGKRARWMVSHRNANNYILFELGDNLEVTEYFNGKKEDKAKHPVAKNAEDVRIEISSTQLTVVTGGKTLPFSSAAFRQSNFLEGKFGFRGPIGVRDFQLQ